MEGLIIVALHMEVSERFVAALRPHGFVLGVVEGVEGEGEVLDLVVILLEEEVIGQVVDHHRVPAVNGVGLTQFLLIQLKLKNRKSNLKIIALLTSNI